ncbi:MAG: Class III cytochrome C family protein [Chloroflexi bacterium ADurb.Bin325]|nr:MAG: Class III cytochrome C family protein [Chloroflexi bacterium ADurb.Bin325]
MRQIFGPSANVIARASIIGGLLTVVVIIAVGFAYIRSPYNTGQRVDVEQPVQFSHRNHVGNIGLDCRYCHTAVEKSRFAGIPPVATCMNCHSQLLVNEPILEPIRAAYRTGQSIQWVRVHNLADFAYFDHSAHLAKGVGCTTCHGPVNDMALMRQESTLLMNWCLDCHRAPEKYLRPRDQVFNVNWTPPADQLTLGRQLVQEYQVHSRTDCSTCHR